MKTVRQPLQTVPGERVLSALPAIAPYADDPGDGSLRRRLAFFPGRALTHGALKQEQLSRIGDAMRLAQSIAPGVVEGFEVAIEVAAGGAGAMLVVGPGQAMAPDGQDLHLGHPLRVAADHLVVWGGDLRGSTLGARRGHALSQGGLTHVMVLVARPLTLVIDRLGGGNSACVNATEPELPPSLVWEDGFQLTWVPWPADRPLPPLDARRRNRVAYAVFNAERERLSVTGLRSVRRLTGGQDTAPLPSARTSTWPWETLGVPLAAVGFDANFVPVYADRAAVVRQGGGRRNRTALVPMGGDDVLWSARVAQWLEHLAELPVADLVPERLAAIFDWLPPVGVLPVTLADIARGRQWLFPPGFDVQALPVPIDSVDALIAESAPLLPYNLSLRDQVQLLVPVPAADYEPGLLDLHPTLHPLFDLEITRLRDERVRLLRRRDGLRRRWDVLVRSITGRWPAYPADDPDSLPDEQGAADAVGLLRVHRSDTRDDGTVSHGFRTAHVPLDVGPGDALVVFVRIDLAVAGLAMRVFDSAGPTAGTPLLVWGQHPAGMSDVTRVVGGKLPAPLGAWHRLSVPIATTGLSGTRIDGIEFHVTGTQQPGRVVWGSVGKAGGGFDTIWWGDALPPGAQAFGTWAWEDQGEPFTTAENSAAGVPLEPAGSTDPGLPAPPPRRTVSEITRLLGHWTAFRNGVLLPELGEMADAERTRRIAAGREARRAVDEGLDAVLVRLDGRVRSASDHVDLGFLRARTDIFRVRQGVLGTDHARRFLTSATAADLVQRDENPVVSEQAFSDYFRRLNQNIDPAPYTKKDTPQGPAAENDAPGLAATRAAATFPATTRLVTPFNPIHPVITKPVVTTRPDTLLTDRLSTAKPGIQPVATLSGGLSGAEVKPAVLAGQSSPLVDAVVGASLLGATQNEVTLADRFGGAGAILTRNAAAKGKHDFVTTGSAGLKGLDLVIDDLPVFGFGKTVEGKVKTDLKVSDLDDAEDLDAGEPSGNDLHEAAYFKRTIDSIDNLVRFLRGVELRTEDYRRLQGDVSATRERLQAAAQALYSETDRIGTRLAEVRHDLSVALALRAEEVARLAALVERRRTVLRERVPYLVFRRPRLAQGFAEVPRLALQPAVVDDPVPRCRSGQHAMPAELQAMVDTLRDVPARWLRPLVRDFGRFDQLDDLTKLLGRARERLAVPLSLPSPLGVRGGAGSATGLLLGERLAQHERQLTAVHAESHTLLPQTEATNWKQALLQVQQVVAIRDIVAVAPSSHPVTLRAAGLLDDIAGVAACLHDALCQTPAALRLHWAERFSQLDAPVSLRQLSTLPGFGRLSPGTGSTDSLDPIAWRRMQALVDWLFAQVIDEPVPVRAIDDLVRVCVLLSAHAPVKRIVSARLRRPVPAIRGSLLDLALEVAQARVGGQVLVYSSATQQVIARAVIEDLHPEGASARITQVMAQQVITLDATMRVQIQTGPDLSSPATARAEQALATRTAALRRPA